MARLEVRNLILDAWAALSHKLIIGDGTLTPTGAGTVPSWVPDADARRLNAYRLLAAYLSNTARAFLPSDLTVEERKERREYGDPDLLRDRIMAGVLGDNVELVVDGADLDLPDEPDLPPQPAHADPAATPLEQRVAAARTALWERTATGIIDDWEAAHTAQPALRDRQQWLRDWADDEMLTAKIVEAERDIVGLGDGVYVLAWSTDRNRPVVDVYDPGFYFPVLDDRTRDYPTKVHLAWEAGAGSARFVRRLTWELAPIRFATDPATGDLTVDTEGHPIPPPGATLNDAGNLVRAYPWNVDDQGHQVLSDVTCYFSDGTWPLGDIGDRHVTDLSEERAVWATTEDGSIANRLDLAIDFLPVVHIPNSPASRDHYGQSSLATVAQLLDDLQATDTDVQSAGALCGGPVVAISGTATLPAGTVVRGGDRNQPGGDYNIPATGLLPQLEVRPGAVYKLGADGKMDVLDLSAGLDRLLALDDKLLERLSVNARVPGDLLGRMEGSALSGVHLALKFGPFTQLVAMLRLTRDVKYRLLLKFAQRLAQHGGTLLAGANPPARLAFGSFLPSDRTALVAEVTGLLAARAISTQTAVALLVAGGVAVDDAKGEVQRIRYENPAAAVEIGAATTSDALAADWLGVDLPAPISAPAPTIVLPGSAP